jgi:phage-related minor tail protein
MAKGNMVLTLVAQTSKWASGLKKASGDALTFGKLVRNAMSAVAGAFLAVAGAIIMFLPNFIKMGEEARKSERRLENIAKQMGLFGDNTAKVTQRLSEYAEAISYATGVDDELVRSAEAILLTFKNLAKTADTTGGAFDRATIAAVDLAAAGFGEVESNAKQLGKALQDPVKGLTALRKAGVTFTKAEQDKIRALVPTV